MPRPLEYNLSQTVKIYDHTGKLLAKERASARGFSKRQQRVLATARRERHQRAIRAGVPDPIDSEVRTFPKKRTKSE